MYKFDVSGFSMRDFVAYRNDMAEQRRVLAERLIVEDGEPVTAAAIRSWPFSKLIAMRRAFSAALDDTIQDSPAAFDASSITVAEMEDLQADKLDLEDLLAKYYTSVPKAWKHMDDPEAWLNLSYGAFMACQAALLEAVQSLGQKK